MERFKKMLDFLSENSILYNEVFALIDSMNWCEENFRQVVRGFRMLPKREQGEYILNVYQLQDEVKTGKFSCRTMNELAYQIDCRPSELLKFYIKALSASDFHELIYKIAERCDIGLEKADQFFQKS